MTSKKKLEERKIKWGTYLPEYNEREVIKLFVYDNNTPEINEKHIVKFRDLWIYTCWVRSLEANNYDLEHPDFYEYKQYFKNKDVVWLKLGYSYVNMKFYKKWRSVNCNDG